MKKKIEQLIQNVLSEQMDKATLNVKQIVSEMVQELLAENWDTNELARLITTDDNFLSVRDAASGHEIRKALGTLNFKFEDHDIDPTQIHWGNVFKILQGKTDRYREEPPPMTGWEPEQTPKGRWEKTNTQYNSHGDPNDYTYDPPQSQIDGEMFQDKLDRYRREY